MKYQLWKITAVYACVRILAETIASLPLHTYKSTTDGKGKARDHPIYYLLSDAPNPEMTSFACPCLVPKLLTY